MVKGSKKAKKASNPGAGQVSRQTPCEDVPIQEFVSAEAGGGESNLGMEQNTLEDYLDYCAIREGNPPQEPRPPSPTAATTTKKIAVRAYASSHWQDFELDENTRLRRILTDFNRETLSPQLGGAPAADTRVILQINGLDTVSENENSGQKVFTRSSTIDSIFESMSIRDEKEIHSLMLDLPLFVDNDTRTESTRVHLEYAAASAPAPSAQVEKPSVNKAAPADDVMKQIAALTKRMNDLEKRADASDKENGELKKPVQELTLRNRADKSGETIETKELIEELIKNSVGELEAENVELKKRLRDLEMETNRMRRALLGAHKAFEDMASTPSNSS